MASSNTSRGGGGDSYGTAPFRSREGLTARPAATTNSYGEIQLQIDGLDGDMDNEITGLRKQVGQLKTVAQDIGSEAKFQNNFVNELQTTLFKAQASMKNNMRRLNRSIKDGSNHVMHVVLFALFCFLVLYFWSKFSRR